MKKVLFSSLIWIGLNACGEKSGQTSPPLFEEIKASDSGMDFANQLSFDEDFNIFTYRNYYNGGGVALGDVNNDGLLDIYFTANMGANKLFLNRGDFKFEDVTESAGVAGTRAWSTGVAMADVNGDGLLDIYVCNSGDIQGDNKQNELFINQGDGTFKEQAEEYGLADQGFSTHAVFFDYDKDGDLDVYLLNNSYQAIGSFNKMQNERPVRDPVGGDKLFRNDDGTFTDVSEEAGIYGSLIGFGLGITIGDVNQDTWPDIFISNDFFEKDYLYINNQDGTFTESLENSMRSISAASMGADIADINGDGYLDIFVTDMLPEPPTRLKQVTTFENWDKFQFNKTHGYHYQFSRNMLHINNGDGTFSELGRLANVEATDWSWGALIFDMDNDGLRDLFVANGIYQDITDLDYLNFIDDDETKRKIISNDGVDYKALIDPIPVNPVPNYAFQNLGELRFENKAQEWGLGEAIHSNGAAYGDLDNDGALDLVVNNVNKPAQIFRNLSKKENPQYSSLQLELIGEGMNTAGIGAQVRVITDRDTFYAEQMPNRGFQSSVDPRVFFGLGEAKQIKMVEVLWPSGKRSTLQNPSANQLLQVMENSAKAGDVSPFFPNQKQKPFFTKNAPAISFEHTENTVVDFDRDRLTYHMYSTEGPAFAQGDVNGDGQEDLFFGGAKGFPARLYLQNAQGEFIPREVPAFEEDQDSEDTDAVFFDANGDGFLDLFVTSGGNESGLNALDLADRLYLNDGRGNLTKSAQLGFAQIRGSSSSVAVLDANGDQAPDLVVGGRLVPFVYGAPASSQLWVNDGFGNFTEQSALLAPAFKEFGLVTDILAADWDQDGNTDLVLVQDWGAPVFFRNTKSGLEQIEMPELDQIKGWYRSVAVGDFNEDGIPDFVLGNQGENTRFKASKQSPIQMHVNDFDQNGAIEHITVQQIDGALVPFTLKHELEKQIPSIKKQYLKYSDYNDKTLGQIFPQEVLDRSIVLEVNELASGILLSQPAGNYTWSKLPRMAQKSWIFGMAVLDLNSDGHLDLILGGNLKHAKPEVGKYDASQGEIFLGDGRGNFRFWENISHGLKLSGDVRGITTLSQNRLLIVKNAAAAEIWKFE
ncbi:VCBS repeat-containing protein [Algoriphagus namhaensis]